MKPQFTPGSWNAKRAKRAVDGEFDWGISADFNGKPYIIAEAFGIVSKTLRPNAQANAHLIAAAPDLYATLAELVTIFRDRFLIASELKALATADLALRKARGEQPDEREPDPATEYAETFDRKSRQ